MKTPPCQPDYPTGTKISPGVDLAGCTYSVRILWSETSESALMPVPFLLSYRNYSVRAATSRLTMADSLHLRIA